jgi:hypothetical protein
MTRHRHRVIWPPARWPFLANKLLRTYYRMGVSDPTFLLSSKNDAIGLELKLAFGPICSEVPLSIAAQGLDPSRARGADSTPKLSLVRSLGAPRARKPGPSQV